VIDVRPGGSADVPTLVDLMFLEPSREAVAMAGDAERARRFRAGLLSWAVDRGTSHLLVAEEHGGAVGFAEVSTGGEIPALAVVARLAIASMGVAGAATSAWRSRSRLKVDLPPPPGGLHLAELQVDPRQRNRGIGARLLEAVDDLARGHGLTQLSLTTTTTNPARHLYERAGYEVVAETADPRYERASGSSGRVLMTKTLPPPR
jgi:ribosomal protein S18 acetylase RimI-like enzyme